LKFSHHWGIACPNGPGNSAERRSFATGATVASLPWSSPVEVAARPFALERPNIFKADQRVEFAEWKERQAWRNRRAGLLQGRKRHFGGVRWGKPGGCGEDREPVADPLEFLLRANGRFSSVGHVGHHRASDPGAGLAHFLF